MRCALVGPRSGRGAPGRYRSLHRLMQGEAESTIIHATCVAIDGHGVLLTGASGSGKSGLALSLMGMGATLVADDRTRLVLEDGALRASTPAVIAGLIEARGVGILRVRSTGPVPVRLVVDLDREEKARLPDARTTALLGQPVPLLYLVNGAHFPSAILHYVKAMQRED